MTNFEIVASSTGHSFGVYSGVDVLAKAYAAGGEDGASWAHERLAENELRAEHDDAPLSLTVPAQGWDEACINGAGFDVFAKVCGLTAAQVEERGDLYLAACEAYNKGAVDNAKLAFEGE